MIRTIKHCLTARDDQTVKNVNNETLYPMILSNWIHCVIALVAHYMVEILMHTFTIKVK